MKKILISLPDELLEYVDSVSKELDESRSSFIATLISDLKVTPVSQPPRVEYDREVVDAIRTLRPELRTDSLVINTTLHNFLGFISKYPAARVVPPPPPIPTISHDTPLDVAPSESEEDITYESSPQ